MVGSRAIFWNFSISSVPHRCCAVHSRHTTISSQRRCITASVLSFSFLLSLWLSLPVFPSPSVVLFLSPLPPLSFGFFSSHSVSLSLPLSPVISSCLPLSLRVCLSLAFSFPIRLCPPLRVSPFFSFPLSLFPSLCRCRAARSYSAQGRCLDQQRCYAAATLAAAAGVNSAAGPCRCAALSSLISRRGAVIQSRC